MSDRIRLYEQLTDQGTAAFRRLQSQLGTTDADTVNLANEAVDHEVTGRPDRVRSIIEDIEDREWRSGE